MSVITVLVQRDSTGHFAWYRRNHEISKHAELVFALDGNDNDIESLKERARNEARARGIDRVCNLD